MSPAILRLVEAIARAAYEDWRDGRAANDPSPESVQPAPSGEPKLPADRTAA